MSAIICLPLNGYFEGEKLTTTDERERLKFEKLIRKVYKINPFSIMDIADEKIKYKALTLLRKSIEHLEQIEKEAEKMEGK